MSQPSLTLQALTDLIMEQAKNKGFGVKPEDISVPEKMALIHSEVSEAYSAYRHQRLQGKDGFEEELGDIIQRVLHLCGVLGIDIEMVIRKKLQANADRTWDWSAMNETGTHSNG
jgi:NTP pyrophosphatase (non-canonical NTP hydrolase)